ncbi:DUF6286 domain-containing protein [Streptacidiphilus sp. ASG 303]|uniref:DUF6286 domain-containing protein n=1 Tax=Streptacidiphilus sp. ASG 303 TaxID=2896847 RepID=UPI001E5E3219|nr:DUF6286 domain-containing protein [Streptacidiphilus sp. ASG 303]MCD0486155.1 DUF6286 domain-containing protein [Streptacidiphilus sp. ASG 303]
MTTQQDLPVPQAAPGGSEDPARAGGPRPSRDGGAAAGAVPDAGPRPRRPWSARRVPAALVAAAGAVACGTLLYDVVAVRTGAAGGAWRRELADGLATLPLSDARVLAGAAAAALLGLWLLVLALTPGLRGRLPLRVPGAPEGVRADLERRGAALLLRDAALRVPGVGGARVRVGRRRVRARVDVRFRDPRQVREDVTAALRAERRGLSLARPPRLSVRVRRAPDRTVAAPAPAPAAAHAPAPAPAPAARHEEEGTR